MTFVDYKKLEGNKKLNNVILEYFKPIDKPVEQSIKGKPLEVRGIAIDESLSYNGVKYEAQDLSLAAPSLIDKPLLKDHNNSVDAIIGRVKEAWFEPAEKAVKYVADVMDEKIIEMILDGRIKTVSIGAKVDELEKIINEDGSEYVIARGINFMELSAVACQGIAHASLTHSYPICLSEKFNGGKIMVEENKSAVKEQEPVPVQPAQPAMQGNPEIDAIKQQIIILMAEVEKIKQSLIPKEKPEEKPVEAPKEETEKLKQEVIKLQEKVVELETKPRGIIEQNNKNENIFEVTKWGNGISYYDKQSAMAKNYAELKKIRGV